MKTTLTVAASVVVVVFLSSFRVFATWAFTSSSRIAGEVFGLIVIVGVVLGFVLVEADGGVVVVALGGVVVEEVEEDELEGDGVGVGDAGGAGEVLRLGVGLVDGLTGLVEGLGAGDGAGAVLGLVLGLGEGVGVIAGGGEGVGVGVGLGAGGGTVPVSMNVSIPLTLEAWLRTNAM